MPRKARTISCKSKLDSSGDYRLLKGRVFVTLWDRGIMQRQEEF